MKPDVEHGQNAERCGVRERSDSKMTSVIDGSILMGATSSGRKKPRAGRRNRRGQTDLR
jgi:hypothetical protein